MDNTFYSPYPPQMPQNYVQAPLTRQQIVRVVCNRRPGTQDHYTRTNRIKNERRY